MTATGTLHDGIQYYVIVLNGDISWTGISQSQYNAVNQKYQSGIEVEFEDNCPYPQFLPEQDFIGKGFILYIDPTNRGRIRLVAPIEGPSIPYRYENSAGQLLQPIHHLDILTDTFS